MITDDIDDPSPPRLVSRRSVRRGSAGRWRYLPYILAAYSLFLPGLAAEAQGIPTVVIQQDTLMYPLGSRLEYLEDPQGDLTLEQVRSPALASRFVRNHSAVPNFGFTRSAYWFRIHLASTHPTENKWFLELQYPHIDHIELFQIDQKGVVSFTRGGDLLPFNARAIKQRSFVFEVPIARGEQRDLYIRVRTESSLQVPAVLWSPWTFLDKNHNEQYVLGIYYGIVLAMLVYNLLLYLSIRDTIYLHYVGYISAFVLLQLSLNGLAYEYLWPNMPVWNGHALILFLSFSVLFATQFTRALLETRQVLPKNDKVMIGLMAVMGLGALMSLFISYSIMIRFITLVGLCTMFYLNIIGFVCWKKGVKLSSIYIASWSIFLVGSAVYGLKASGALPSVFITDYAIQIGSALEALMLSFALAYRIKLLKLENERIQHEATANLEENVSLRTEELNIVLAELSRANQRLEDISRIDGLTGVMNRRHFDETYAKEWNNVLRGHGCIAILLIDLDRFKAVNDTYGHLCGDEVLRRVAQTISACLTRSTDTVARYGGEEFIVLLPHTNRAGALQVAETIRAKVEALRLFCQSNEVAAQKLRVQLSVGVDAAVPELGDDRIDLISNADQALYSAKNSGRNRVVAYADRG